MTHPVVQQRSCFCVSLEYFDQFLNRWSVVMWCFHFHLNRRYTKHWCLSHEALGILLNYSSLSFPGLVLLETSVIHDKMYEGSGDIVDPPPPCCFPDSSSWKQVHFITNTGREYDQPVPAEYPLPVKYRQPKPYCDVTIWFRLAVFHRNQFRWNTASWNQIVASRSGSGWRYFTGTGGIPPELAGHIPGNWRCSGELYLRAQTIFFITVCFKTQAFDL